MRSSMLAHGILSVCLCLLHGALAREDQLTDGQAGQDRRSGPPCNEPFLSCEQELECLTKAKVITVPGGFALKTCQLQGQFHYNFTFLNEHGTACEIDAYYQMWTGNTYIQNDTCNNMHEHRDNAADHLTVEKRQIWQNCSSEFDDLVKAGTIKVLEGFSLNTCKVDRLFRYTFCLQNEDRVTCEIDAMYQLWVDRVFITNDTCKPIVAECKQELDVLIQKGAVHIPDTFMLKTALCKTLGLATDYYFTFQTNDQTICDIYARYQPWFQTAIVMSDTCSPHVARGGRAERRRTVPESTDDAICPSCRGALDQCLKQGLFTIPEGFELKAAEYKWEMGMAFYFTFANISFTSACEIVVFNKPWMYGYVVRNNTCDWHVATRERATSRIQKQADVENSDDPICPSCRNALSESLEEGLFTIPEGFELKAANNTWEMRQTYNFTFANKTGWEMGQTYNFTFANKTGITCEISIHNQLWMVGFKVTKNTCVTEQANVKI